MDQNKIPQVKRLLEQFEAEIETKGEGVAPNGATYRLTTYRTPGRYTPAYWRIAPDGRRELIVGYNSVRFDHRRTAKACAVIDGRHELGSPGDTLPLRKTII